MRSASAEGVVGQEALGQEVGGQEGAVRQTQGAVAAEADDEAEVVMQQEVRDFGGVEAAVKEVEAASGESFLQGRQGPLDDEILGGRAGVLDAEGFQPQGQVVVAEDGVGFQAPVAWLKLVAVGVADEGQILKVSAAGLGEVGQVDGDEGPVGDIRGDALEIGLSERVEVANEDFSGADRGVWRHNRAVGVGN